MSAFQGNDREQIALCCFLLKINKSFLAFFTKKGNNICNFLLIMKIEFDLSLYTSVIIIN